MAAIRILAVLDDIHPKALVEVEGRIFAVEHPKGAIDRSRPLPPARLEAAIAKHGYVALEPAAIVPDEPGLVAFLEERTKAAKRR